MDEETKIFYEIAEGMRLQREHYEKAMGICDYLREVCDLYLGRKKHQEEPQDLVQENKSINDSEIKEITLRSNIKNLYHRKDGRWEYKKRRNGELIRFTVSTKEEAIEKLKDIKNLHRKKVESENKTTFVSWCNRWVEVYKQDLTKSSKARYQQIIDKYITPFFKDTALKKVTQEKVQIFINGMEGKRNKEYAFLTVRQILKQAYVNKKIADDISAMLVKPKRYRKIRRSALALVEQQEFLKYLKNYETDVQMFMMFSIICGTRRSETMKFKFEDINEMTCKLHIKGTKTYGSDRYIKISPAMINLLKQNKQRKDDEFYFSYAPDYYTKIIQEIYKQAGIKDRILHDLRHTCATNLLYLGVADKFRQQYLGHANIVMTNDVYTNLQDDITADGLAKLYNNLYPQF